MSGIEKGDFYCYEIKSCVEDFNSGHGLNFIGDYNYIVCPNELYEWLSQNNKLPFGIGIYTLDNESLKCARKARRKDRQRPICEMLLMMFRSVHREYTKIGDKHD